MKRATLISILLFVGLTIIYAEKNLESLFIKYNVSGSIVIFNLKKSQWIYSDQTDANKETIPASTFKVINSLIALEENVVTCNEIIKWDGKDKTFKGNSVKSWNADSNLESAFKNSVIWFYVELSKRINRSKYAQYLKKCNYGNNDLSEKGDDFWNYGNLKISPKNQVEFLIKLYKDELPFKKQNMELIKSYMRLDSKESYILSGKSGWGIKDGNDIGLLIGYLEKGNDVYVYATRIIVNSKYVPNNFGNLRLLITLESFKMLKIID